MKVSKYYYPVFFIMLISLFIACKKNTIEIKHYCPAQVEIIASNGTRVVIDSYNKSRLSSPVSDGDIVTFTHMHPDHYNPELANKWAVQEILFKNASYEQNGIKITSIPSAHDTNDEITDEAATNYILLIETDGLRICHLGDIGQEHFTQEQLDKLGEIDICFTQTENDFSSMDMQNKKGFILINELKPRLVILTHFKEASLEYAIDNYPVFAGSEDLVKFSKRGIPEETTILLMGDSAAYGKIFNLENYF